MTKDAYIFINSDQSTCRLLVGFRDSCGIEKYHDGFFPPKKTNTSHPLGKNGGNHIIFNICALFSVGICELYTSPPQKKKCYLLDIRIPIFSIKKKTSWKPILSYPSHLVLTGASDTGGKTSIGTGGRLHYWHLPWDNSVLEGVWQLEDTGGHLVI